MTLGKTTKIELVCALRSRTLFARSEGLKVAYVPKSSHTYNIKQYVAQLALGRSHKTSTPTAQKKTRDVPE